jgi:hypothetical protein
MLILVMTLSAGYQGSIAPMRLGSIVIQGTRAAGGPPWCPFPGRHCRQGRRALPLCESPPDRRADHLDRRGPRGSGLCTGGGQPAGTDPLNPPPPNEFRMIRSAEETSHLEQVKDRRSQADGDRLMAGPLRHRDHPEESRDAWTPGPAPRRKA